MGLLGDITGAITNTIDAGTGGWWSDSSTKASAKRNLRYNLWLQDKNQKFQKYMAENAHQMEVQDLMNAGLNPALSTTGSSAGSIASSSSAQGTSPGSAVNNLSNIVDSINGIRKTNAEIELMKKQGEAEIMTAYANKTNANTNKYKARGSKEGAIGEIASKGMRSTLQGLKEWFSK